MTIITTPGDPNANSYGDVAGFRAYAAERPHAPELPAQDVAIEKYLIHGTRLLETNIPKGIITYQAGALLWPRDYVLTRRRDYLEYYDKTQYPQPLVEGLYELALDLVNNDVTAISSMAGYERVKLDTLEFVANPATERPTYSETVILFIDHLFEFINDKSSQINFRVLRA